MGEGEGTSHALRPAAVLPVRCAAKGCPGLRTGVAAAQAGDLWNAGADLHMHQCPSHLHICMPHLRNLFSRTDLLAVSCTGT